MTPPALRVAILAAAVALMASAMLMPLRPSTVHACSAGQDWDPVAESEVIVAGRITGWVEVASLPDTPSSFPFQAIRVELAVDDVIKGGPVANIDFIDAASLGKEGGLPDWRGSGGACGAFNEDPTGSYAIPGPSPS